LDARRVAPYIVGLIILAFALGSLPRTSAGGSILFRSYWLLYLVYLGPVIVLAAMVALVIIIGINWRDIGAGIGLGIARRKKSRKRNSWVSFIVAGFAWAIAIGYLISTGKGIFGPSQLKAATVAQFVGDTAGSSSLFQGGFAGVISTIVQSSWFSFVFLGLLAVGSLVIVQAVRVSLKETGELDQDVGRRQIEGLQAIDHAIRLVDDPATDPRSRIISSYQLLILTVSRLGAPASPDMTARELEAAISSTFSLTGSATGDLTRLFEEARYSLHEITGEDAVTAHDYLDSIAKELKVQLQDLA
jgi:hypothetical protein